MTLNKQPALDAIEKEQNTILHVADEIWDYAELSLQEFRSAKLYCEVLKQEGFRVEEGVCGIATAFAASFGSGRPHIGILAEYDALSGLSQQGRQLVHAERTPGGRRDRRQGLAGADRLPRHRHALRLPRRRGRRSQGFHGTRRPLEAARRRAHLAPGGLQ